MTYIVHSIYNLQDIAKGVYDTHLPSFHRCSLEAQLNLHNLTYFDGAGIALNRYKLTICAYVGEISY